MSWPSSPTRCHPFSYCRPAAHWRPEDCEDEEEDVLPESRDELLEPEGLELELLPEESESDVKLLDDDDDGDDVSEGLPLLLLF